MDRALEVTAPAARALLSSLVDYAGLFPPASLPLEAALAEYSRARRSPASWLLGRLVVPAARLDELAGLLERPGYDGFAVSALAGNDPGADARAIAGFNERRPAGAFVDAVETKGATPAEIEAVLSALPADLARYVELPVSEVSSPLLAALRSRGARAKLRTGGIVPAAIPEPAEVARFISACASAGVAFKATAGLHHPLRRERPLTYAEDAPRAVMHGFLNVFVAAALARSGGAVDLEAVLREESPAAFRLDQDGLAWRQERVSSAELEACRGSFAVSFGSCSFAEPVEGLRQLGLIA